MQIVAEQSALLDVQQFKAAGSPAAQADRDTTAAAAACTEGRLTAVHHSAGSSGPKKLPSSPLRPSGQQAQDVLAADWLSQRRSLSQLATSLPPKQPCSEQVAGSPDRHSQGLVVQLSQRHSIPGHTESYAAGNSGTSRDPADFAVRIAGMEAALAFKEAEVVRMWRKLIRPAIRHNDTLAHLQWSCL